MSTLDRPKVRVVNVHIHIYLVIILTIKICPSDMVECFCAVLCMRCASIWSFMGAQVMAHEVRHGLPVFFREVAWLQQKQDTQDFVKNVVLVCFFVCFFNKTCNLATVNKTLRNQWTWVCLPRWLWLFFRIKFLILMVNQWIRVCLPRWWWLCFRIKVFDIDGVIICCF